MLLRHFRWPAFFAMMSLPWRHIFFSALFSPPLIFFAYFFHAAMPLIDF